MVRFCAATTALVCVAASLLLAAVSGVQAITKQEVLDNLISGKLATSSKYSVAYMNKLLHTYPNAYALMSKPNTVLFVPTDDTWNYTIAAEDPTLEYPAPYLKPVLNVDDPKNIEAVLKYHFYDDWGNTQPRVIKSNMYAADGEGKITTLNPQRALLSFYNGPMTVYTGTMWAFGPHSMQLDKFETDTGPVIVIDGNVLIPPVGASVTANWSPLLTWSGFIVNLNASGLYDWPDRLPQATVFMPNTTAFEVALASLKSQGLTVTPKMISEIIKYHISPELLYTPDVPDAGVTVSTYYSANGAAATLTVKRVGDSIYVMDALNTDQDVTINNGNIIIINKVLLPPGFIERARAGDFNGPTDTTIPGAPPAVASTSASAVVAATSSAAIVATSSAAAATSSAAAVTTSPAAAVSASGSAAAVATSSAAAAATSGSATVAAAPTSSGAAAAAAQATSTSTRTSSAAVSHVMTFATLLAAFVAAVFGVAA